MSVFFFLDFNRFGFQKGDKGFEVHYEKRGNEIEKMGLTKK